jgi:hypothetical protein
MQAEVHRFLWLLSAQGTQGITSDVPDEQVVGN